MFIVFRSKEFYQKKKKLRNGLISNLHYLTISIVLGCTVISQYKIKNNNTVLL